MPSLLHRQAEAGGYRRTCRSFQEALRSQLIFETAASHELSREITGHCFGSVLFSFALFCGIKQDFALPALKLPRGKCFGNLLSHEETTMLFKSSASPKENPGSKRLRRTLGLLLGSHWMRRRLRRYAKYQAIAGKKPTVTISQLATAANVSPRRVENDLEQMVQKGFWGKEAYLDLGQGVLVRTFEAAEDLEQAQKEAQPIPEETREGYSGQLRDIRYANDRIADPVISAKIDRLEDLAGKIFRIVEEEPAKKAKASTFLNYYLPTTQKLLDSYADFEESGVSGENVSQAKQRIASTMDNIVAGFERQLDQLYQSDAMDVDSDIRVMEQMLRRDSGSVAEDFGLGAAVQQEEE